MARRTIDGQQYDVYEPIGACRDLFLSRHPRVVIDGPAGTGKSRGCLELVHALLMKYPGARALFVRQTLASMRTTLLVTYEDEVLPEGDPIKRGASRESRMVYNYPNGSEIVLFGLLDVDRSLSGQFDIIYVQQMEECQFRDIQKLTTRLRNGKVPYQRLIADCNPGAPTHWIKEQEESGWLTLLQSTHEDNPRFFNRKTGEWTAEGIAYISILDALQGHEKERLRYGRWVSAEGSRFTQLDERKHLFTMSERFPYGVPDGARILMGIDYGKAAPYCALWTIIDHDRNPWVFREDYKAGLTSDEQALRMVQRTANNERVTAQYADPSIWAETTDHTNSQSPSIADVYSEAFRADGRFGPLLRGYNKSQRVYLSTLDNLLNHGNGYPDLRIERSAVNLWKELCEAVWWDPKSGQPKEEIDPRCANHAITALAYQLHTYYDGPDMPVPIPTHAETLALVQKDVYERELKHFARTHTGGRRIRV